MLAAATGVTISADALSLVIAVRDFGALHARLVPGFVLDTKLDGEARIVSFANGTVARELLVDCDDTRRRLVYAVISERMKQHGASVQVNRRGRGKLPPDLDRRSAAARNRAHHRRPDGSGGGRRSGQRPNVIFLTELARTLP